MPSTATPPLVAPTRRNGQTRRRALQAALLACCLVATGLAVLRAPAAFAAGEQVNIWLTTTSDARGRTVTRGLQPQTPIAFATSSGAGNQTVTVNENVTYQQFEGAGASFTDTAAWLIHGSGASARAPATA